MLLISPYSLKGSLKAIGSKSYLQRALAIAAMAESESEIKNVTWSADSEAALNITTQLGASARKAGKDICIQPGVIKDRNNIVLHCQESGLCLRMFAPIAGLYDFPIKLDGTGTLLDRPLLPLINAMRSAGVDVYSKDNKLPVTVRGPIRAERIKVDGSFSSQVITGLLIALPLNSKDTVLEVAHLKGTPYIDMTIEIMQKFGIKVDHEEHKIFYIRGNQRYRGTSVVIEGDWSAAANFLVAAAISGEITMSGLDPLSKQADRSVIHALQDCGARISWRDDNVTVQKNELNPFDFDASHCPDLFPPLAVLAAACSGSSCIKGTQRLLYKESNRIKSMEDLLVSLGIDFTFTGNELSIQGKGKASGGRVDSHADHRIAMAAAIAGAIAENPIEIIEPEVVRKSYPDFFVDLESCVEER